MSIDVTKAWWFMGGNSTPLPLTSPIAMGMISPTELFSQWSVNSGTSYEAELYSDAGYTALVSSYAGTLTYKLWTGLTVNTTYYLRVRSVHSGGNSNWVTTSAVTMTFTPMLWLENTAFFKNEDNEYGTTNNTGNAGQVTKVKDRISGNTITPSSNGAPDFNFDSLTHTALSTNNIAWTLLNSLTLAGDFQVTFEVLYKSLPSNHYLFADAAGTTYIRFSSTSMQIKPTSGGPFTISYGLTLVINRNYKFTVYRTGTTFYCSINEAAPTSVAGNSNNFTTITTMFAQSGGGLPMNAIIKRLVISSANLSSPQLREVFDFLKMPDYVPSATVVPTLSGLTWSALPADKYIVDSTFNNSPMGAGFRQRIHSLGKYAILHFHKNPATGPTNSQSRLKVLDRTLNLISNDIDVSDVYLTGGAIDTDVHNNGSSFIHDNRLKLVKLSYHYDFPNSTLKLIESGPNFDLTVFKERIIANNIPRLTASGTQYPQVDTFGSRIAIVVHEPYALWGTNQSTVLYVSTDNGNSWVKKIIAIFPYASPNDWFYPILVSRNDGTLSIVFNMLHNLATDQYFGLAIANSTDNGDTWTSPDGTFSQTVANYNPLTGVILLAAGNKCVIADATATSGDVKCGHALFYPSTGEIHGICGNVADNTGLDFFYIRSGVITKKAVTPSVISAQGVITTWIASDGDNIPVVIKRGASTYDLYCHADNSTKWTVVRLRTVDDGDTWTFEETISTSNTLKHQRLMYQYPMYGESYQTIVATRVNADSTGSPFVMSI